jgi:glycosyltransferase involved in cell wall biosynthesis
VRRGSQITLYLWAAFWLVRNRSDIIGVVDAQCGVPFFSPLFVTRRTPVILLIFHIHQDQFSKYFPAPFAAIARWLESTGTRWVYGSRAIIAISPSTRRAVRRELKLRGPITVVPPGLDINEEQRSVYEKRCDTRASFPTIVSVGRMVLHKRGDFLIDAMIDVLKARPTTVLHFVGDGTERFALQSRVVELGLTESVVFHGVLPAVERDDLMRTAWITVIPSAGEGWGLSVVEANALGVPAVAFRVPGLRDSIREGKTGWLLDPEQDLAEGILAALDDVAVPAEAEEWGTRSQRWARRFDWDTTAELFGAALESERKRRFHGRRDQRSATDLAMVARARSENLPVSLSANFRSTDRLLIDSEHVTVFLPGCDAEGARNALDRVGLGETPRRDIDVRIARPTDYLSPGEDLSGVT